MENFNKPLQMDFITFAGRFGLNSEQYSVLEPLYNSATSYSDFFKKIDTDKCNILYNWIEGFVRHILEGTFESAPWVIDIDNVESVPHMDIIEKTETKYKTHIFNLEQIIKRNLANYNKTRAKKGGKRGKTHKYRTKFRFAFTHEG